MDFHDILLESQVLIVGINRIARVASKSIESDKYGLIIKFKVQTDEGEYTPEELTNDIGRPDCQQRPIRQYLNG